MKEACDLPGFGRVAVGALLTKQRPMLVAEAVAGRAIEHLANLRWLVAGEGRQGVSKRSHAGRRWLVRADAGLRCPQPGLDQGKMIHLDRSHFRSLVLDMTVRAIGYCRVERGRLLGEQECVGCVARDAGRGLDPPGSECDSSRIALRGRRARMTAGPDWQR